ncbi:hypothetical protein FRC08_008616 [Ceratobasidium sp. 394]|nr:hypothetical protein FRC08_008616 [Ceratobasidium sp. 394]
MAIPPAGHGAFSSSSKDLAITQVVSLPPFYFTRLKQASVIFLLHTQRRDGDASIWSKPGSVKRFSPEFKHNICRVGSVSLSPDEKSIAVSTLDHSIVFYALGGDGPLLESMREFPYNNSGKITPIVPIAFTADGLTLGGTACGEVATIYSSVGEISMMRHGKSLLNRVE